MTKKKKKSSRIPHFAFHDLIGEMSYWGAALRIAVVGFVALAVFTIQVIESQASPANMTLLSALLIEGRVFVYIIASFLIFDVGYVMVSRKYSFSLILDKVVLIGSEFILALCYFLPYFAIMSDKFISVTRYVFVAALLVLAVRVVMGILYGRAAQK